MLSKTVHLRPLRPSNVIRVKTPEKAARIHERNSIVESDHDYKPVLKISYDSNVYKFQKQKLSKAPNPKELEVLSGVGTEFKESTNPCHVADYNIYKKKKFNEQLRDINSVPTSNLISPDEYRTLRSSSVGFGVTAAAERGEEADKRNLYRRNFFISKPFAEINKDFKFQPLVRNAQTTSEDTPYWMQSTAKFYTRENFDLTSKMRTNMSKLPKTDIFGKADVKYSKTEYPSFVCQPPSKGQRYELNKMVIVEKRTKGDYDPKVPHIKLRWDEEPQKQSYDKSRLAWKVGKDGEPYIKKIKAQASWDPKIAYKKIGEDGDASRLKKEKAIDLKIGHPNDQYNYTKKTRDDGFLANRKEIIGENYSRSNFFCG